MSRFPYFVCPIEYSETLGKMTMDCVPPYPFQLQEYVLPESIGKLVAIVCSILQKYNIDAIVIDHLINSNIKTLLI